MGWSRDGDGVVEGREAELSERFGDEEEMGGVVEVVGIGGRREFASSKEDVFDDSFQGLRRGEL